MIVLVVLGTLVSAMLALGTTEPQIAANLVRGAQALALAEAGAERAIADFNATPSLMQCVVAAMNPDYPTPPTGCSTGPLTLYGNGTAGAQGTGAYTVTYRPTSYATVMVESTGSTPPSTRSWRARPWSRGTP
jgi:Tfp pilus assembly protein PilX